MSTAEPGEHGYAQLNLAPRRDVRLNMWLIRDQNAYATQDRSVSGGTHLVQNGGTPRWRISQPLTTLREALCCARRSLASLQCAYKKWSGSEHHFEICAVPLPLTAQVESLMRSR